MFSAQRINKLVTGVFFMLAGILWISSYFFVNPTLDIQLHDTYFVIAYTHLACGMAAFLSVLGGGYLLVNQWKILNPWLSLAHGLLTLGALVYVFYHLFGILGITGYPRRYYSFPGNSSIPSYYSFIYSMVLTGSVLLLAQGICVLNWIFSPRRQARV